MERIGDFLVLSELRQSKLLDIFCSLAEIPSPSLYEEKVTEWISNYCAESGLQFELDEYKNVLIKIAATNPDKKPILLSAHMDVVGDFSPVNLQLDGDFIQTDGKRTLGADDKAGVACALFLASELSSGPSPLVGEGEVQGELASRRNSGEGYDHGGLEIVLTRDEEHGMSGIKHLDFRKLYSKYVFVLDADKLGQLLVSGASYTNAILKVTTPFGGHSGIDIHEKHRLNAAKLIAELIADIPQGVFHADETGTITSINLGTIIGGNIQNTVSKVINEAQLKQDEGLQSRVGLPTHQRQADNALIAPQEDINYLNYFIKNSVTNVINTEAQASYSIRSADVAKENELKHLIQAQVDEFNSKYGEFAHAEITFSQHLPPFEKADDDLIEKLHAKASTKLGIKSDVSSFHAGAETHIYAQNANTNEEKFSPFLVGLADIYNMHSCSEKINYKTLLQGYELLKELFIEFNQ